MLRKLTVSNIAVVERAVADFAPGLNVLTGETGAGKSVLMGALDLVLGGRSDSSVVREGAREAEVEAEFDDHTVRRTVTAQGKSRAWIDDESVTIAELKDLARGRVDVHGPTANQALVQESFQRAALDAFADSDLAGYSAAWSALAGCRAELAACEAEGADEDALDLLRYQIGELESAALTEEDETVGERQAAAANAGDTIGRANEVTEALGGSEGASAHLAAAASGLEAMARHLPAASGWAEEARRLATGADELSRAVADAVSDLDVSPEELEALDARLATVNRLKRKYLARPEAGAGAETDVGRLMAVLDEKRVKLSRLEGRGARLEELAAAVKAAERKVREEGAGLSARRRAAAAKLSRKVTKELRDLGFLQAKFTVSLEPCEPAAHGCDRVTCLFEPNPGEPARPLAAIASSGEIARVMLALKGVLAAHDRTAVLVFDEVDANIGGEIGSAVGERLRRVAGDRQVIAITHLPQSAVWADRHLVVRKGVSGGRTRTTISVLEGEDRIAEVARMLGDGKSSGIVREHAKELLENAR